MGSANAGLQVAYAEWTEDEQLRQTTFLGWRDDKKRQGSSARAEIVFIESACDPSS
jgi:ATP-dependent DNA ligase